MGSLIKSDNINVIVVGKSPLVRKGIISLLADEDDIMVVAEASSRIELFDNIYNGDPHVLVIDCANVSQTNILETIKLVFKTHPKNKVLLIINKHNDSRELTALRIGVTGILYEGADKAEFVYSIRRVNAGKLWIRQSILENFIINQLPVLSYNHKIQSIEYLNSLTNREIDILNHVTRGYKNKQIAERLFISEKTVKNHISSIFKKLKIKKRVELKKYQPNTSF